MRNFDPHQYAIDAGWDFTSVEATAKLGVAPYDIEVIIALTGDDHAVAVAALHAWCRNRVSEREGEDDAVNSDPDAVEDDAEDDEDEDEEEEC